MKKYQLGLYEKALPITLGFKDRLEAAKQCGFDFLEISVDETDEKQARLDWTKDEIFALKKTCFETDMPIQTMCLSGNRKYPIGSADEKTAEKGVQIIRKAIDFSALLGIRIIQIAGYDVYYEESTHSTRARFFFNLKKCVDYAAMKGVILAMETMENDFMNTVEKAMHYVHQIDSPYLQIYPDTGNLSNGSKDIVKDILGGKGHIAAAHLKETKQGIFREVPYGTGQVEFDAAIAAYYSIGVNLFMAEFWHNGKDDWMEEAKSAHRFLSAKLDQSDCRL